MGLGQVLAIVTALFFSAYFAFSIGDELNIFGELGNFVWAIFLVIALFGFYMLYRFLSRGAPQTA